MRRSAIVMLAAVALAACGGDPTAPSGPGTNTPTGPTDTPPGTGSSPDGGEGAERFCELMLTSLESVQAAGGRAPDVASGLWMPLQTEAKGFEEELLDDAVRVVRGFQNVATFLNDAPELEEALEELAATVADFDGTYCT